MRKLLGLLLLLGAQSACPPKDYPLVQVEDEVINTLLLSLLTLRHAGVGTLAEAVNVYVGETLAVLEGKKMGISVSDQELEVYALQVFPEDLYRLFTQIYGDETVRTYLRHQYILEKTLQRKREELQKEKGIQVTDQEIRDYYISRLKELSTPERIRFQYLLLNDEEKAREALQRWRAGDDIEQLWKEYSLDTKAYDTGTPIARPALEEQFGPEFVRALFRLPLNEPRRINLRTLIVLVKVMEKYPATQPKLEEVRDAIRERLLNDKLEPYLREWMEGLRKKYTVRTDVPFFQEVLFGEQAGEGG